MIIKLLVNDQTSNEVFSIVEEMGYTALEQGVTLMNPHFILINRITDTFELSNNISGGVDFDTIGQSDWLPKLMDTLLKEGKRSLYPFRPKFQIERYLYLYCEKENKGRSEGLNHLVSEFMKLNPINK